MTEQTQQPEQNKTTETTVPATSKKRRGFLKGIFIGAGVVTTIAAGAAGYFLYEKYKGE